MIIRLFQPSDLEQLRAIHARDYEQEFPFPFDGENKLLDKYVVVNDRNIIITFGSLEVVTEGIVITNKVISVKERREAFYKLLQCLQFSAQNHGFGQFHATVQENKWVKHLTKEFGFRECKGKYLYLDV
jgi:hypothetical protein